MKILHTSDWHLNEKIGQIPRQKDISERLEEIAGYLEEYKADLMVISGDLFSLVTRMDEVRAAVAEVGRIFRPFLLQGGTIVGISGNHDSEDLFNLFREAMNLAAPKALPADAPKPAGRMYLFEQPGYMRLADPAGNQVQFALLPYPTPSRYLKNEQLLDFKTPEERNRNLHNELLARLDVIRSTLIDVKLPAVLVSHMHVRGQRLHNLYHLSETQDVVFEPGDLPLAWAYIAFGHIHLPQAIPGTTNARYAGSVERFDYAEAKDDKSVVLLEVGKSGLQGEPVLLPLHPSPVYKIEIHNPAELDHLEEIYPDARRAIVEYQVIYKPGEHNPDAIRDAVEKIFPRWWKRQIIPEGADLDLSLTGCAVAKPENVPATVRAYLQETLAENSDREDLLALADELLASL
jgi:DNA repair protein SbcD/Mre11